MANHSYYNWTGHRVEICYDDDHDADDDDDWVTTWKKTYDE